MATPKKWSRGCDEQDCGRAIAHWTTKRPESFCSIALPRDSYCCGKSNRDMILPMLMGHTSR
uniref:Uncharacterized protein n=1 Tax=Amphimedon queenslandica TaxID=400682 RepID=A0A1X7V0E9_AMPQE